mgnify:CR=1 FL=1
MSFQGYSPDGLRLLSEIGAHDGAWFDRHRDRYQAEIVVPTKQLVNALGDALARDLSPDIVAQPRTNGSIAPINNDVRFARDKPPYKDHVLLRFWEGADPPRPRERSEHRVCHRIDVHLPRPVATADRRREDGRGAGSRARPTVAWAETRRGGAGPQAGASAVRRDPPSRRSDAAQSVAGQVAG